MVSKILLKATPCEKTVRQVGFPFANQGFLAKNDPAKAYFRGNLRSGSVPKEKILVVEDERDIQELISYNLTKEGYKVTCASSGEEALRLFPEMAPDLVVLDVMLPGLDGLDVCREIRGAKHPTGIIILTARDEEADVVTGLELGADDYLTKPFSPRVLKARIKALLRRGRGGPENEEEGAMVLDEVVIHPGKREVKISGIPVQLTNMEFRILHLLGSRRGWAFSRAQIVAAIRGEGFAVTDRSVDTIIVGLRRKMGDCCQYVETVRGVGYRFKDK